MTNLPEVPRVVQLPDGTYTYTAPDLPTPYPAAPPAVVQPQVVHVHQAPPDRTVQRVALGSGIGAGTVAAGVYFGPLLVAAITSMAISLAVVALVVVATAWGVVTVVRSVGGPEGTAAAKNLTTLRRKG
ncbi:DUF6251 family protein [Streptomyces sp. NPDC002454]